MLDISTVTVYVHKSGIKVLWLLELAMGFTNWILLGSFPDVVMKGVYAM